MSFHRPLWSPRIHGAIRALQDREVAARWSANLVEDERAEAALRGKAKGYREAIELLRAIERGYNFPRRLRWTDRRLDRATKEDNRGD